MSTRNTREELTTFLNLQTDYAFKLLFGTEGNKHIVIRFLNALLGDWLKVTDVRFHDKEVLPSTEEGKRIVYDVYCTSKPATSGLATHWKKGSDKDREHHFILEMQNIYNPPFEERMVYYTSKAISSQGKAGWDYNLDPVVAVAVMDFNMGHLKPKLVRDMVIADRDSGEVLTEKVHIFLISLPELPEKWEECRTELEQMTFLIKHMEDMTDESRAYIEGKYAEMFEAARTVSMSEDAVVAYSQSWIVCATSSAATSTPPKPTSRKASRKANASASRKVSASASRKALCESLKPVCATCAGTASTTTR